MIFKMINISWRGVSFVNQYVICWPLRLSRPESKVNAKLAAKVAVLTLHNASYRREENKTRKAGGWTK